MVNNYFFYILCQQFLCSLFVQCYSTFKITVKTVYKVIISPQQQRTVINSKSVFLIFPCVKKGIIRKIFYNYVIVIIQEKPSVKDKVWVPRYNFLFKKSCLPKNRALISTKQKS